MVVAINYKTDEERAAMRRSGRIVGQILAELRALIKPGITTRELDAYAESRARAMGAEPAFKGYRNYPASLCASVNEVIIHGIPSNRVLREGDIVGLDFGVLFEGFYGDAAVTCPVGRVDEKAEALIAASEAAFFEGLERLRDGGRISDISHAIQSCVETRGFSVIRDFVGHGIGRALHEEPQIPNFGAPGRGPIIRKGLTLAIEPMIAAGRPEVEILSDGWTACTRDRSLASHFEHTVALTENGPEILSLPDLTDVPRKPGEEKPYA
ncbi:MAG: type I methionyl aminopeptidase [Candidatus Aminicenantes bacterium]|nr:type I methionyl aminopeptidase [Candidatus Aminicenantes bacterium]